MSLPVQSLEQSQSQQQKSQRKSRTLKFLDSDVVRTLKRRLVTDDVIELTSAEIKKQLEQRCSLNIDPRNVQELILEDELDAGYVHLLEEYSLLKKRRIEHVGTAELEQEYEQNQRSQLNEQNLFENYGPDFEFDNDNMLESRQFEKQQEQEVEDEEQEIEEEEEEESNSYSQNILSLVTERDNTEEKTNFSYIFSNLNKDQEIKYPKKFATKCFFELLVLATSKKIELKQDGLFQEIEIKRVYV
ncbi:hypothetical protein PACTADRAFT_185078 [Pachysolen tannophilus NRRL Y-2460]|uniref:Rad21/Rec8-like protein C-terminal eukaryotic domain-containing protein n=1 Tax=Pachysolen tannophilus NRRL Y-2460 TaxID=669874 RepID=A0A1E4U336_PACTA|nr:hypothetical protein PACTADRAFT_185078 [Pachysolen tannophilus NRRL Y-2460]